MLNQLQQLTYCHRVSKIHAFVPLEHVLDSGLFPICADPWRLPDPRNARQLRMAGVLLLQGLRPECGRRYICEGERVVVRNSTPQRYSLPLGKSDTLAMRAGTKMAGAFGDSGEKGTAIVTVMFTR